MSEKQRCCNEMPCLCLLCAYCVVRFGGSAGVWQESGRRYLRCICRQEGREGRAWAFADAAAESSVTILPGLPVHPSLVTRTAERTSNAS